MPDKPIEITCARCGHTWPEDLARLDKADQVIFKDGVRQKVYRLPCPRCRTRNVVTVAVEEAKDG